MRKGMQGRDEVNGERGKMREGIGKGVKEATREKGCGKICQAMHALMCNAYLHNAMQCNIIAHCIARDVMVVEGHRLFLLTSTHR